MGGWGSHYCKIPDKKQGLMLAHSLGDSGESQQLTAAAKTVPRAGTLADESQWSACFLPARGGDLPTVKVILPM